MNSFRTLVVLKRPWQELWVTMRDHLPEFAGQVADIAAVHELERTQDADGGVRIVNRWQSRQQIPPAFRAMLQIEELVWVERNRWHEGTCTWTIEPDLLGECVTCSGETVFTPAMAGQGTRVSFSGELEVKPGLRDRLGNMAPLVSGFLEPLATTLIPRNLRAVIEAAAEFGIAVPEAQRPSA